MRRAYFLWPEPGPPERAGYCQPAVALGRGLRAIGVEVYGNRPYWREPDGGWLFPYDPEVTAADCDVLVVGHGWFGAGNPFPPEVSRRRRPFAAVYVDAEDGERTRAWERPFRRFDLVLRAHGAARAGLPGNAVPWAFGIAPFESEADGRPRRPVLLVNHRYPHPVRVAAETLYGRLPLTVDRTTEPLDEWPEEPAARRLWAQTGRRYHPRYRARLREAAAVACFGGYWRRSWGRRWVSDWDSFRLWEAFAAGAAVFHLDFDHYGLRLPVLPKIGRHYVGVRLDRPEPVLERLREDPLWLVQVGREGREWALVHYGPEACARRLREALS